MTISTELPVISFAIYRHGQLVQRQTLEGKVLKIGRMEQAQVRIDDPKASRMHAVLEIVGDGITLIDLGSEDGTFVNDKRINKCALRPGDRIRVGSTTVVLEDTPPAAHAAVQLPTPERVRAEVGEGFAPERLFGVAALVLQVDGVRRNTWSDEVELSRQLFDAFPRDHVPVPDLGPERSYKVIDDTVTAFERRCSSCVVRPGKSPCTVCLGTGAGSEGDRYQDPCGACRGEGFLSCSTCGGSTRVVACSVRYVNDAPIKVRRALVPEVERKLRSFLEAAIDPAASWPDALVFDPEPSLVGTAYRGASAVRATPDFRGFFFGDAVTRCLAAREEASSGLARFVQRVFAIPVLWTIKGEHHAAYFFDPAGALRHVTGASE